MISFHSMSDSSFAILFAAMMLMAAIPNAREFWQKVQRSHSDTLLKHQMLSSGASADEIVRSLLSGPLGDPSSDIG